MEDGFSTIYFLSSNYYLPPSIIYRLLNRLPTVLSIDFIITREALLRQLGVHRY